MVVAFFRLLLVSAVSDLVKAYQIVVDSDGELVVDSDGELVDESNAQEKVAQTLKILNSSDENVAWKVRTTAPKANLSSSSSATFMLGEAVVWKPDNIPAYILKERANGDIEINLDGRSKTVPKNEIGNKIRKYSGEPQTQRMKWAESTKTILTDLTKAVSRNVSEPDFDKIIKMRKEYTELLPAIYQTYNKESGFDIERASEAWTEAIELSVKYPVDRVHRIAENSWRTEEPLECLWIQQDGQEVRAVVREVKGNSDAEFKGFPEHGYLGYPMAGVVKIGATEVMPDKVKFVGESLKRIGQARGWKGQPLESATMEQLLSYYDYRNALRKQGDVLKRALERQEDLGALTVCCWIPLQNGLGHEEFSTPFQKHVVEYLQNQSRLSQSHAPDCHTLDDSPSLVARRAPMECCEVSWASQNTCVAIILAEIELDDYWEVTTNEEYRSQRYNGLKPALEHLEPSPIPISDTRVKGTSVGELNRCHRWLLKYFATMIASLVHEEDGMLEDEAEEKMLKMHSPKEALVICFLQFQNIAFGQQQNVLSLSSSEKGHHVYVIGDIHGKLASLLYIMKSIYDANLDGLPAEAQMPKSGNGWLICKPGIFYVFLGDYVDRGDGEDIKVITLLLAYRALCPFEGTHGVLLLRGNHEDMSVQAKYGFMLPWLNDYLRSDYHMMESSFVTMPIAAILNDAVLLTHGGLQPDNPQIWKDGGTDAHLFEGFDFKSFLNSEENALRMNSDMDFANQNPLCTMMWADPMNEQSFKPNPFAKSPRGVGFVFNPSASDKLCTEVGIMYTIRGHEYSTQKNVGQVPDRHNWSGHFGRHRTLTVFSAANYQRPHPKHLTQEIMKRMGQRYSDGEKFFGWRFPPSNGAYAEVKDGEHLNPSIHEFYEVVVYEKSPDSRDVTVKSVCKHAFTIELQLGNPKFLSLADTLWPLVDSLDPHPILYATYLEALVTVECRDLVKDFNLDNPSAQHIVATLRKLAEVELRKMKHKCATLDPRMFEAYIAELSSLDEGISLPEESRRKEEDRGQYAARIQEELQRSQSPEFKHKVRDCLRTILRLALSKDREVGQLFAKLYGEDRRDKLEQAMTCQEAPQEAADLAKTIGGGRRMPGINGESDRERMDFAAKVSKASPDELASLTATMRSELKSMLNKGEEGTSSAESLAKATRTPVVSPGVRSSDLPKGSGSEGIKITGKLNSAEMADIARRSAPPLAGKKDIASITGSSSPRATLGRTLLLQESYSSEPIIKVEGGDEWS